MKLLKYLCIGLSLLVGISCASQKVLTEKKLEKTYDDNLNGFGTFIWHRNKDSTIVVNKKNLEKIYKETAKGNDKYFNFLNSYILRLTVKNYRTGKKLQFSERAYIAGYVIEYLYKCQQVVQVVKDKSYKKSRFIFRLLSPWDSNKYNKEFKKHDYYGLELLKKHHLKHYKYFPDEEERESNYRKSDSHN